MYAELKRIVCETCSELKPTRFHKTAKKCQDCAKKAWAETKAERRANKRKASQDSHKIKDFKNDLMKNYGITVEQYDDMYQMQQGRCGICTRHSSEFKRRLHVDHDHATGQVRGLLCTRCNPGLGYFGDSVTKLEMAITYLTKFKKVG